MTAHRILLCVDNSTASDHAVAHTAVIGAAFGSEVTAAHVYAAHLHDRRFSDLEPNLPQEYQSEQKLESSRRMHAGLIGRGLHMISDSYLKAAQARLEGLTVEGRNLEGTNYVELVRESARGYDLTVIGARGLGLASLDGEVPASLLGSVCERVVRRVRTDVLVVKDGTPPAGTMLVAVDGSPESYAALRKAIKLAGAVGAAVEAVTCFDPDYHPVAFKAIEGVLSEKHAKVFKFRQQETLHNEIIDHGLENLYQGYLDNAKIVGEGRGFPIETRLLTGRPAWQVAARAREAGASLVVVGRFGRHRTPELDIGGTAEAIVRLAPGNVMIINETPDEVPLDWTAEAQHRVEQVPQFMRPMVRKAIESHARARGLTRVTAEVVTAAKTGHGVPMPGHAPADTSSAP